jgi:UDP-3-O-acyl-N-acetylglucosamine deacetylase
MSALAAAGVTDVHVEIFGAEVPMMDGSSLPWIEALREAGVREQAGVDGARVMPIVVTRPVRVESGATWIEATPAPSHGLEAEYRLDYGQGAPIAPSTARFTLQHGGANLEEYAREIAPARTFATLDEALGLRKMGLFSHLREGDTLVIGPDGPVGTTYRVTNEPARHKVLDLIGDLALAGRPIVGRVVASQSGHALNQEMAAALLAAFG